MYPSVVAGVPDNGSTLHVYIGFPQEGGLIFSVLEVLIKSIVTGVHKDVGGVKVKSGSGLGSTITVSIAVSESTQPRGLFMISLIFQQPGLLFVTSVGIVKLFSSSTQELYSSSDVSTLTHPDSGFAPGSKTSHKEL